MGRNAIVFGNVDNIRYELRKVLGSAALSEALLSYPLITPIGLVLATILEIPVL